MPPPSDLITPSRPQTRAAVESNDSGVPAHARQNQQDVTTSRASISEAAVVKPEEENISRTTRIMRRVAVNYLVNRRNPPGRKILKNKEISEEIGKGFPEYLKNTTTGLRIMTRSRILEVGSGTG